MSKEVAEMILRQLGGNKFIAMTGSKNFVALENGLRMKLSKNESRANLLKITLNATDLYDMEFIRYTPIKVNMKTFEVRDEKMETIREYNGVYGDMLQDIFTQETGLRTSL